MSQKQLIYINMSQKQLTNWMSQKQLTDLR